MPRYVMLNFEDAGATAVPGLAVGVKGKNVPNVAGIGGAAVGTVKIYHNRALGRSTWYKRKQVVYYPCQEILQRDLAAIKPGLARGTVFRARICFPARG